MAIAMYFCRILATKEPAAQLTAMFNGGTGKFIFHYSFKLATKTTSAAGAINHNRVKVSRIALREISTRTNAVYFRIPGTVQTRSCKDYCKLFGAISVF